MGDNGSSPMGVATVLLSGSTSKPGVLAAVSDCMGEALLRRLSDEEQRLV